MISDHDLDGVLAIQRTDGRRLGTLLVEQGLINETQLTQILSHQLAVPWVSLLHIEFSRQLLNLVPREVAERYCLLPIYVRHVRNQGETLYVAMEDPTNEEGLGECGLYSGLPVRAMIAPPSDIRNAIRVYYGGSRAPVSGLISEPPTTEPDLRGSPIDTVRSHHENFPEAGQAAASVRLSTSVDAELAQALLEGGAHEADATSDDLEIRMNDGPEISVIEEEEETIVDDVDAPSRLMAEAEVEEDVGRPTLESIPSDDLVEASRPGRAQRRSSDQESLEDLDGRPLTPPAPESLAPEPLAPEPPASKPVASGPSAISADVRAPVAALLGAVLGRGRDEVPPSSTEEIPSERAVDSIPQPQGRRRRMISLTLLDGTTITLPARSKAAGLSEAPPSPSEGEESALTARDLVAALRAVSQGADANEIIGANVRWEAMFAALLSLLLKKHLIADWEFVEELKKI